MTDQNHPWPLWTSAHEANSLTASQEHGYLGLAAPCPACGRPVPPDERFCENCGADVHPEAPAGPASRPATDEVTVKLNRPRPSAPPCLECGGRVDADGYCETCGAKAPSPRDHFELSPAPWVGGVCDRGRVHARNEDALALWATADGEPAAVLVVCDGVSSSVDSDVASLAAAERARDVLVERLSDPPADALVEAAAQAQLTVVEHTADDSANAASCTFAAAVVSGDRIHWAGLGDSRVYLIGAGGGVQLSTDHSVAEELIAEGLPRAEAEAGPHAHTITRWLGRDAADVVPDTGTVSVGEHSWLVVCSDGLWNYASAPAELARQMDAASQPDDDPVRVAARLVAWANTQGGKDNVTVALARLTTNLNGAPQAATTSDSVQEKD